MRVSGKVAVVTGGARGLGKAFSEALLMRGAKVCMADLNVADGENTLIEFSQRFGFDAVHFVKCDVSDEEQFRGLMEDAKARFKQIHIMVNNAGMLNENMWKKTIDVNLKGVVTGTYLAIDYMRKDKGGEGGVVLNIASVAGLITTHIAPVYVASKHGVIAYTRSLAASPMAVNYGVRLCCLCPGFTNTAMLQSMHKDPVLQRPEYKDDLIKMTESMGIISIEEVTSAFMQLLEADDNNGAVMVVDKHEGVKYKYHLDESKL